MAITDVLRGLLGGAGGALAGYGIQQQREQERLERERIRQEAAAEREADRAYRRQIDEQNLALELLGRQARGEITPTEYVEYAEPSEFLRGERIGMQRQPSADLSSLLVDEGIGMQRSQAASAMAPRARDGRMEGGAMVAPGQTYSAIDAALAEAPKPEDIGARGRRATQDLDRALTIEPEDIAARFERAPAEGSWTAGRGTFEGLGGQMYRATTQEERAAAQFENRIKELRAEQEILAQIQREQRVKTANELEEMGYPLTNEERREFITTGDISRFAPRAQGFEDRDPFGGVYSSMIMQFMQNNVGRMPTPQQRADIVLDAAIASGISLEEAQRRAGVGGGPPPPPPPSDADEAVLDPILQAEKARQEQEELSRLSERDALARYNMLQNSLDAGSYLGREVTESMRRDILKEIRALRNRYNFPVRGFVEDISGSGLLTPSTAAGAFGVGAIR